MQPSEDQPLAIRPPRVRLTRATAHDAALASCLEVEMATNGAAQALDDLDAWGKGITKLAGTLLRALEIVQPRLRTKGERAMVLQIIEQARAHLGESA